MKNLVTNLLILFFILLNICLLNAQIDTGYEIGAWQGFSSSAVSYTWDDNTTKQLTVAQPIFDKYDFKTTFYIVSNWGPNWAGFQNAANIGHEVSSHTKSHPNFNDLNEAQIEEELEGSKNTINSNITGNQCLTMAYPYCVNGNDTQTASHYISARTCQGQIEKSTPTNMMQISSIICGTEGPIKTSIDFNNKVTQAIPTNGWVVFLLHGIDNDGGYSPIDATELDVHLQYMSQHKSDHWIATYSDVVKYIKERDAASLKELSNNNNEIVFELKHNLGSSIYDLPLTVKRQIPSTWLSADITQGTNSLNYQIIEENGMKFIVFNAVPNSQNISIVGHETVAVSEIKNVISELNIFPNPANKIVNIDFNLNQGGFISISIIDQQGKLLKEIMKGEYSIGEYKFQVDVSNWGNQLTYCVAKVNGKVQSKKLITNQAH